MRATAVGRCERGEHGEQSFHALEAEVRSTADTRPVQLTCRVNTDAGTFWEVSKLALAPHLLDHALGEALDAHRAMGSQASRVAPRADANIDPGPTPPLEKHNIGQIRWILLRHGS